MNWRTRVRAAAVVALAPLACGEGQPEDGPATQGEGAESWAEEPRDAPPYSAVTLAGDSMALADLQGSPVLLNVWATWCAPCRQEIPELQALHEQHADEGLRVVGVSVDTRSALDDVHAFVDEFGMTYEIWLDPDQDALSTFNGMGVPLTVLVGPDGRIRWEHLGVLERNDPELREAIARVL